MNSSRIFSSKGRWVVLLVVLLGAMIFVTAVNAGTVGLQFVMGTDEPDTRGGIYTDDTYVWIADHKDGSGGRKNAMAATPARRLVLMVSCGISGTVAATSMALAKISSTSTMMSTETC